MAITDRAQENMNYVHTLLKTNQPEFAALLEQLEQELSCQMLGHISGHSRGCVVNGGRIPC